jgi:hypothetical protein
LFNGARATFGAVAAQPGARCRHSPSIMACASPEETNGTSDTLEKRFGCEAQARPGWPTDRDCARRAHRLRVECEAMLLGPAWELSQMEDRALGRDCGNGLNADEPTVPPAVDSGVWAAAAHPTEVSGSDMGVGFERGSHRIKTTLTRWGKQRHHFRSACAENVARSNQVPDLMFEYEKLVEACQWLITTRTAASP